MGHAKARDCQDHNGQWIRGFGLNIDCCSITIAELWRLYQGLMITWEIGIRWLLVEVDSLCVTQLIASSSVASNAYSQLTFSIQELLKCEWRVDIKHIYCEANFAADALANYAHSLPVGLYIFNSPLASINHILLHDLYGVTYPRFVLSYLSLRSPYVPKKIKNEVCMCV